MDFVWSRDTMGGGGFQRFQQSVFRHFLFLTFRFCAAIRTRDVSDPTAPVPKKLGRRVACKQETERDDLQVS